MDKLRRPEFKKARKRRRRRRTGLFRSMIRAYAEILRRHPMPLFPVLSCLSPGPSDLPRRPWGGAGLYFDVAVPGSVTTRAASLSVNYAPTGTAPSFPWTERLLR